MLTRLRSWLRDASQPTLLPPGERMETKDEILARVTKDIAVHAAAARRYQDITAEVLQGWDRAEDLIRSQRTQRIAALDLLNDLDWPTEALPLVAQVRAALGDRSPIPVPLAPPVTEESYA